MVETFLIHNVGSDLMGRWRNHNIHTSIARDHYISVYYFHQYGMSLAFTVSK